jgi:predicted nuclease with TOPRIM domain
MTPQDTLTSIKKVLLLHAELDYARKKMNEGRNREQLLLHRLSAAKSVASQVHEKLHRIRSDLEEANSRIQQLRTI